MSVCLKQDIQMYFMPPGLRKADALHFVLLFNKKETYWKHTGVLLLKEQEDKQKG